MLSIIYVSWRVLLMGSDCRERERTASISLSVHGSAFNSTLQTQSIGRSFDSCPPHPAEPLFHVLLCFSLHPSLLPLPLSSPSLLSVQCRTVVSRWRTRGLSRWRVRQLPKRKYKKGKEVCESCSICLEDFRSGDNLRVLPCDHSECHVTCGCVT